MIGNYPTTTSISSFLSEILSHFRKTGDSTQNDIEADPVAYADSSALRPECGGYNEAFVIQYWASYGPY